MAIEIIEQPVSTLDDYASVSPAFRVERILEVDEAGDRLRFVERAVAQPYVWDRDTAAPPAAWSQRFDVTDWGLLAAFVDGRRIGGAVIAPGDAVLGLDAEVGLLWDLRIDAAFRRRTIGTALFRAAEDLAASQGYRRLRVETPNINAAACAFFEMRGCTLSEINPDAYPGRPDDLQLVWGKRPERL